MDANELHKTFCRWARWGRAGVAAVEVSLRGEAVKVAQEQYEQIVESHAKP